MGGVRDGQVKAAVTGESGLAVGDFGGISVNDSSSSARSSGVARRATRRKTRALSFQGLSRFPDVGVVDVGLDELVGQ